jgi:hypothetical protein
LTLQINANLAEKERGTISDLTRAATVLGNGTKLAEAAVKRAAANREAADGLAANVLPIVRQIRAAGGTTHRAIADAVNARGIRTWRGGNRPTT